MSIVGERLRRRSRHPHSHEVTAPVEAGTSAGWIQAADWLEESQPRRPIYGSRRLVQPVPTFRLFMWSTGNRRERRKRRSGDR